METLREIERKLAYNKAKNAVEFCCWPRRGGWFDTGDSMAEYLTDEIFYLQSIGALQVHPENPALIKVTEA